MAFLVAVGTACEGCPICIKSKQLDDTNFISGAAPGGTVQLWEWIGDGATTFSY